MSPWASTVPSSLWAASGQSALESARVLVISARATSTSILKNLVLPGIGHFTILDHESVSHADAGNNFFLDGFDSIGKNRATEAVRSLAELNDGTEGVADTRTLSAILDTNPEWLTSFTIIIAYNLDNVLLERLSSFLWSDPSCPPLVVVRSAGFLAEFFIQFREHTSEHPSRLQFSTSKLSTSSHRKSFRNCPVTSHRQAIPSTPQSCVSPRL